MRPLLGVCDSGFRGSMSNEPGNSNPVHRFLQPLGCAGRAVWHVASVVCCWLWEFFKGLGAAASAAIAIAGFLVVAGVLSPTWGPDLMIWTKSLWEQSGREPQPAPQQTSLPKIEPKLTPVVPVEQPRCVSEQPWTIVERIGKDAVRFGNQYKGRTLCQSGWTLVVQWTPQKLDSGLWRVWVGRTALDGPMIEIDTRSNLSAIRTDDKVHVEGMLWRYEAGSWFLHPLGKFKVIDAKVWKAG